MARLRRQMQRHGQRVAAQPAEPPALGPRHVEHGHVEPVLQRRQRRALDAVEEPAVGGAAAQVDVLAVVDGQFAALEGEGEPAEARPAFEQGDAHSGVGERERGGDTGEPAADHDGGRAPGRPRTCPVRVGQRTLPCAAAVVLERCTAGRRSQGRRRPSGGLPCRCSPVASRLDRTVASGAPPDGLPASHAGRRGRTGRARRRTPSPGRAARPGRAAPPRGRARCGRAGGGRCRPWRRHRRRCAGRAWAAAGSPRRTGRGRAALRSARGPRSRSPPAASARSKPAEQPNLARSSAGR